MHDSGRILSGAARVIAAVDSGRALLDEELDAADPRFRRSISHLALTFYRRRKQIDALLKPLIARPPHAAVRALLQAAATQIFFQTGIAPESAVNVAVDEAKSRKADKFVNAVLRQLCREQPVFSDEPEKVLPGFFLERRRHGAELSQLTSAFLAGADFTFRLEQDWPLEGVNAEALKSPAFRFFRGSPGEVLSSAPFRKHHIYVQDPAASLAFQDLDLTGASRALDLCAAPGGKTLMLAELLPPDALLIAADRSRNRQRLTRENLEARGVSAEIITALPEEIAGVYDVVLADVPCSNTGVFRRRPDALWRFSRAKLEELTKLQFQLLEQAARLTAPGGKLIYSTCSIEDEENRLQVEAFLARHGEFTLVSMRQLIPDLHIDGAFASVLKKKNS